MQADLADRNEPMVLPDALEITGPLPAIASSRLSLPAGMEIALPADEFPAGYNLTALLDVRNVGPTSVLKLSCAEDSGKAETVQVGQQNAAYSLQRLSPDQLFLAADTSAFPAGCSLEATIANGIAGQSQPYTLARIVRIPQIDSFDSTPQMMADGKRLYILTGHNLEMIEKVGWDQLEGVLVAGLPAPIQGQGQKQALQINLPDPPPQHAVLYVWLRGEKSANATTLAR